jgi:hypothetical protein
MLKQLRQFGSWVSAHFLRFCPISTTAAMNASDVAEHQLLAQ